MEGSNSNIHVALRALETAMQENDVPEIDSQLESLQALGRPQTYDSIASTYEFGGINVNPRDDLAFEWYMRSALEQDNCESYYSIGRFFYHGKGMQKDVGKSMYYYEIASNKGSSVAGITLGSCYIYGDGVPFNLERADRYLKTARENGYVAATLLQSKIEFKRRRFISGTILWFQGIFDIGKLVFSDINSPRLYGVKTKEMLNDDIVVSKKKSTEWSEKN